MSPSKKAKNKPFFQSLYSSKNSKKTEETKSKAGKSVQARTAATTAPAPEDRGRPGKKSSSTFVRQRKRSASPFQRFLKRRKDDWSVSKIPVKKKISSPTNASVSLVTCAKKKGNDVSVVVSPVKRKQSSHDNQLQVYPQTVPLATAEDSDSDSDQSDAGFSTISGGTVIFVPPKQRADLSGETFEKGLKGSINKALSKRDLVLCDHSVKGRNPLESSVSLRTRSRSVDNEHDLGSSHLQSKRSRSASEAKGTHRPNARASFKVTNETKKILQRAQVPSENLIQPGIISSTPNTPSVDKIHSVRRASSANETLQQSSVKEHAVRRTASMAVHKQNSSLPVLKSNILKTRMMLQNQQQNMNTRPSPSWCRPVNEGSATKPLLKRNISEADHFCKTPKCTRLRRISNPLPASPTSSTPVSSRRKTEYKQMIKACLNSPNLHKNSFPPETKMPESELAKINFDYLSNQQDMLLYQLRSIEKSFKELPVPKPPKMEIDLEEPPEINHRGKENNSVFLSPAPIIKYRRERLPMESIDTEDGDLGTHETGNHLNESPHTLQSNTQSRPRVITSEEEVPIIYVRKDPKPLPQIQSIGVHFKHPKRVTPHILSYYKYARFNV
ncbi:uncharacterized protein LOC106873397 [Octopus bimaculoides]|uniref:Uncharacterized protein n=1 Tax=Octopus bimaculoides TaxID=37653 RepID=A0A0L8H1E3_OCTBM|nr:uncharacterized protein LOC106873397 [Octopus bimaculoides]|eukprot:XP_014776229.1 PREDICTED: uncharacterized protein LOC106873397 [Octopus bimaculoides]